MRGAKRIDLKKIADKALDICAKNGFQVPSSSEASTPCCDATSGVGRVAQAAAFCWLCFVSTEL